MKKIIFYLIIIFFLFSGEIWADVPHLINYQGKLLQNDAPANGHHSIIFRLYPQAAGGAQEWESSPQSIHVTNGLFSAYIGDETAAFTNMDWSSGAKWLEVIIDGDVLSPRERLTSVAYSLLTKKAEFSLFAKEAERVGWSGITNIPAGFADGIDNTSDAPAGGDLTGTFPNPTIGDGKVNSIKIEDGSIGKVDVANEIKNYLVPIGTIVMWSGSFNNIPGGWALCDGSGGTPDLRDRFIYGVNAGYGPGNNGDINTTGGNSSHIHTYSSVPIHNHGVSVGWNNNQAPTRYPVGGVQVRRGIEHESGTDDNEGYCDNQSPASLSVTVNHSGSPVCITGEANHTPSYYKLAFIIKL
ncbi:MAG: phage tail protein [Spirochaetes bacterium]|nr:phage tail protein [Spirochaetota bacterium]